MENIKLLVNTIIEQNINYKLSDVVFNNVKISLFAKATKTIINDINALTLLINH